MSKALTSFYLANNDTATTLITIVNTAIQFISTEAVSANSQANGALTTGNAIVNGIFGATTLFAGTMLRGGNVQAPANLTIGSNAVFNANVFLFSNSTQSSVFSVGNTSANATNITADNLAVGTNFAINSTSLTFNGSTFTNLATSLAVASLVNAVSTNVGSTGRLNFVAGSQCVINAVANASTNTVDVKISLVANAVITSAGLDTQVQFNDNGAANGLSSFVFLKSSNTLSVSNTIVATNFQLGNVIQTSKLVTINAANTLTQIDAFTITDYRSAEYLLSITDNAANNYAISKMIGLQDGGNFYTTEYAVLTSNSVIGAYTMTANATHAILSYTTSTSANVSIRIKRTLMGV